MPIHGTGQGIRVVVLTYPWVKKHLLFQAYELDIVSRSRSTESLEAQLLQTTKNVAPLPDRSLRPEAGEIFGLKGQKLPTFFDVVGTFALRFSWNLEMKMC